MKRSAGVLMAVSSLSSPYGIGTLGKAARDFVDFLSEAGQTYWQMLPVGPTGFGNSPYQLISIYAGNPYLIDLEDLKEQGYLTEQELKEYPEVKDAEHVDYGQLYKVRYAFLQKACRRLSEKEEQDYYAFIEKESYWLKDYALFMALKEEQKGLSFDRWPKAFRDIHSEELQEKTATMHDAISLQFRMQYFFYKQMNALRDYAHKKGILLIGDLPFYSGQDSLDVWADRKYFLLQKDGTAAYVAGMPGQKWGNPLFDWEAIRADGYAWWLRRVAHQYQFFDVLRIDHFRGYFDYYKIPADSKDAMDGEYCHSVGLEPFRLFEEKYGPHEMIVEDLGELTEDFTQFVKESGYPGMKILEYAFDPKDPYSVYMPFQYEKNAVVYTGTHDNSTLKGWTKLERERAERACAYMGISKEKLVDGMMRCAYSSTCNLAIVQAQDLLGLDDQARMNTPGGIQDNWCWRSLPGVFTKKKAETLAEEMKLYGRFNWDSQE